MRVIGTAGHVDHGKSTLVKALTGIDPDRLKEEKEREMTIDLGFAWLTLPSGEQVGIIDVPGHQDFIKNMLAGVGGIDAALLVIAADEGVMPQTREHLAILNLLKSPTGIVVLTKKDLVDSPEWLELVQAEALELVQGSVLEGAPIVPVSAVTGEGLDQLRQTMDEVLMHSPTRPDRGRPRLPVDRVFTMSGFGTIVTGTLLDGSLHVGQEVELLPSRIRARVRGLQSHKRKIETAFPGSRVAVNLSGVTTDQVQRGDVVTLPGWLEPTSLVDVYLEYLADAPRELRHHQVVEFFSGTSETSAYVRLLGVRTLAPGDNCWAQLRLARPVPLVKGDRFIIRQPSPSLTIGGGFIVDPLPRRRHRRFRPEVIQRLEMLAHGTPADWLLEVLDRRGAMPLRALVAEVALPTETANQALAELMQDGRVFALLPDGPQSSEPIKEPAASSVCVTSRAGWAGLCARLVAEVSAFHQSHPLRLGMPREVLKSRMKMDTRLFNEAVTRAFQVGALASAANDLLIRLPDHTVLFSAEQQAAIQRVLGQFQQAPYTTPSFKEVVAELGEEVTLALIESAQLVRLSPEVLLLAETYAELVEWVKRTIAERGSVNVGQLRDAFGTSRKYALALLEYLDDQRITRRVGDDRVLR